MHHLLSKLRMPVILLSFFLTALTTPWLPVPTPGFAEQLIVLGQEKAARTDAKKLSTTKDVQTAVRKPHKLIKKSPLLLLRLTHQRRYLSRRICYDFGRWHDSSE